VELAAAGVSIALFNQASRITIFPLVSITTSFVAEEDTLEKLNNKSKFKEVVVPEDHMLQDLQKEKPMVEKCESKDLQALENYNATRDNDPEIGHGNFSLLITFSYHMLPNIFL